MSCRCLAAAIALLVGCGVEIAGDEEAGDGQLRNSTTNCGGFEDVSRSNYYCDAVDRVRSSGITKGCNPPDNTKFCPDEPVTRAQMASFIARALGVAGEGPASCGFVDVASSDPHRRNICKMKELGITKGCNPPANDRYCPGQDTTRGQMAAFLTRAIGLPTCDLSNYTDVPGSHTFNSSICGLWRAGIAVSHHQPDPANNRFNNTYGPDAPMYRRDMAVFLDRAFLQPPSSPLEARVGARYRDFLLKAQDYSFVSNRNIRGQEVLALIYTYRAAQKVANLPAGFRFTTLLDKIVQGADEIFSTYASDCYSGHSGDGTSYADGCPRFGAAENFDAGSTSAIAMLETIRLLYEIGGASHRSKADGYWPESLWVVAHMNDDHRVSSPCTGWGQEDGFGGIKWNKSNRWAIANHLVYSIRRRGYQNGDGTTYGAFAREALSCFKRDLREASKYRCDGGERCYDSAEGPWWSGWHSDFHPNIEDDAGHGSASAMIIFYAAYDRWDEGAFQYSDLGQFSKHFHQRRRHSASRQYVIPQYRDSDTYPGNRCASPTLSSGGGCDDVASAWDSQKVAGWIRLESLHGHSRLLHRTRDLVPNWDDPTGSARNMEIVAGAFALFGEVGSPRRLSL